MNDSFFKRSVIYFINTIISALLGFLTLKIIGSFIDPDEYGVYSVIKGFYSLFVSIMSMLFSQSILRFYSKYKAESNVDTFYNAYWKIFSLFVLFFLIISAIVIPLFFSSITNNIYRIVFLCFLCLFLFEVFYNMVLSFARSKRMAKEEIRTNLITHLIKLLVFVLYFFLIAKSIESIIIATLFCFLSGIILLKDAWQLPKKGVKVANSVFKEIFAYSLPLIGIPVVNYLLSVSDQLVIKYYFSEYETGIYSMGNQIASYLFSLVASFLITAGHPVIMSTFDKNGKHETSVFIKNLSMLYFILCLPLLVETIIFSDYLILFVASETYLDSSFVLSINSIGIVLSGYIAFTNKPFEVAKKSGMITVLSLIGAIINVVLNIVFIPILGYKFASITTVVSYTIIIFVSLIVSRKIMHIALNPFDFLKLLIINISVFVYLFFIKRIFVDSFVTFLLSALSGIVLYFGLIFIIMRKDIQYYISFFKATK